MLIKDIEIDGFWGRVQAKAEFFSDVTIFIGHNGTGKTTFINLISAVLTVDLFQLNSIQFKKIIINLTDAEKNRKRKISVSSSNETLSPYSTYEYRVGTKSFSVTLSPEARMRRAGRGEREAFRVLTPDSRNEYFALKREVSNLVEVSQISVYRQVTNEVVVEPEFRQRTSAVDERLQQLFERFSRYQLKLETQLNERSTKFQQEALASLLYNEEFDEFNASRSRSLSEIDLETQEDKLSSAFRELGIRGKSEQIKKHLDKLRKAIKGLKNSSDRGVSVDDVFALPLIYRTNRIIDLLNEAEEEKKRITEPRQKFFDTLRSFMGSKTFRYDNKSSELLFSIDDLKEEAFSWSNLSSGEKQLLIQFMEVLLQEGKSLIFIADEPELSLHVTWQEKLLKALRDLNKNAQLIVATHSPDIVAEYSRNVVNMNTVVLK